jgi:hypothetical protein
MRRVLVAVFTISLACVVVLAQQSDRQPTPQVAVSSASHADRLSAKGQELMKEWFRLPSLQNRPSRPRGSSIDLFWARGQDDSPPVPPFIVFEGRIYMGGFPMPGGGWCWDSSDVLERMARLREHLSKQEPSWPPLPRK